MQPIYVRVLLPGTVIIDYVLVCDQLAAYLKRMLVDENRENVLTKYATLKGVRVKSESDHNPIYAEFDLTFRRCHTVTRREIFDFKSEESQQKFFELTDNSDKLRNCFQGISSPKIATDKFLKTLNDTFHLAFKKIRIRSSTTVPMARKDKIEEKMLLKADLEKVVKNSCSRNESDTAKHRLEQVESDIYEIISSKNAKAVTDQVACLDTLDGKFKQIGMWKVKNKICPRKKDPPTAKKDDFGNLITAPSALKNLYLQTYKSRLQHREMNECYQDIKALKTQLWDLRFEALKKKPFEPWTLEDLNEVIKKLKNNQARDPNGMINEFFKPGVAGSDLKKSLVDLMNLVLSTFFIPEYMENADITSIFKLKGSRMLLSNEEGFLSWECLEKSWISFFM